MRSKKSANKKNTPNDYESIEVKNVSYLKQPTIYFFLKNQKFSENYIKHLRNHPNSIILNGNIVTIRQNLQDGDLLQIMKNPNPPTKIKFCNEKLEILYEDNDYLAVFKPHNLACVPTRSHYDRNLGGMICNYMQTKSGTFVLRILNRLDKETAGIVLVAKNVLAYNSITEIKKEYFAICHETFEEKSLMIDKPILTINENGINQMKRVISPLGKRAITHVEVIKNYENYSLVKLILETGRTHQIRVHLSSIGHSLFNDSIYEDEKYKHNNLISIEQDLNKHTFLLLKNLSFKHFRHNKKIEISIDFPNDWKKFIN